MVTPLLTKHLQGHLDQYRNFIRTRAYTQLVSSRRTSYFWIGMINFVKSHKIEDIRKIRCK